MVRIKEVKWLNNATAKLTMSVTFDTSVKAIAKQKQSHRRKNLHNESIVCSIDDKNNYNYSRRYDNDFRADRAPTGLTRCKQFLLCVYKLAVNTSNA